MVIIKNLISLLPVLLFLCSCSHGPKKSCEITRAAIDIGSGSSKMKVYVVNTCTNQIIHKISKNSCNYSEKVSYKESLKTNQTISETVIKDGLKVLNKMKNDARNCGATQFQATATSAFRQARNGREAVKELEQSGINISIISQAEEARLGFVGAADKDKSLDSDNLCVWDIGGSSMQIVCTHNGKVQTFLGHLASIPFKDHILELKKSRLNSPNPISLNVYERSLLRTRLEAKEVFQQISRLKIQSKPFIGIGGVHYFAVSKAINKPSYTIDDLEKAIQKRLNKNNRELGGGKYANTALSNIILVKGMMESMGVSQVSAFKINLTEGLVLSEEYW